MISVYGVWTIPDPWERKHLACSDAGMPPLPNPSPHRGPDRWGAERLLIVSKGVS